MYQVEGPLNTGTVNMHMTKRSSQNEYEYRYLYLDVKGNCVPCSVIARC